MQHTDQKRPEHNITKGPKPLPLHLYIAAAACAQEKRGVDVGQNTTIWHDCRDMLVGIQRYHACHTHNGAQHLTPVASSGGSVVYAHPDMEDGQDTGKVPLLLIPSMINGSAIFDIFHGCSLLAYLNRGGMPAYLLDWGDVEQDSGLGNFTAIVKRLNGLAVQLADQHNLRSIHGFGYCMGGHILAMGATLDPHRYKSLTFLSTPWDFAASDYRLAQLVHQFSAAICAHLSVSDYLSVQWLHTIFALLDPEQVLRKFARFASMPYNSHEADLFVAIEDWLNSTQSLPHELAWSIITRIVQDNALMRGTMLCDNVPVQAGAMHQPAHIIAPQHDKLATPGSVRSLYQQMPNAELYTPDCGHIAPLCDAAIQKALWPGIIDRLVRLDNKQASM